MAHRKYSADEQRAFVKKAEDWDGTLEEFCQENGFTSRSLRSWRTKFRKEKEKRRASNQTIPLLARLKNVFLPNKQRSVKPSKKVRRHRSGITCQVQSSTSRKEKQRRLKQTPNRSQYQSLLMDLTKRTIQRGSRPSGWRGLDAIQILL